MPDQPNASSEFERTQGQPVHSPEARAAIDEMDRGLDEDGRASGWLNAIRRNGRYIGPLSFMVAGGLVFGGVRALTADGADLPPVSESIAADLLEPDDTVGTIAADQPAEAAEPADTDADEAAPTSSNWSIDDPADDWQAWGGFDRVIPERTDDGVNAGDALAAGDLRSVEVSSEGNTTTVDLGFGGDAQAVEAFARSDFSGQIEITLEDGTRWEITFKDDDRSKIISATSGMSITREWVEGNRLRLTITGLTVGPGATLRVAVALSLFDGSSQDTAILQT